MKPTAVRTRVLVGVVMVATAAVIGFRHGMGWWRGHRHDALIRTAASQHGVPAELVKAVVWRESRFDEHAMGSKGEIGLMQVTADAAQEWADKRRDRDFRPMHLLDPATNLQAGSFYLAKVARRYAGTDRPFAYALADYNAGRGNVLRWMKGPARTNSEAFLGMMSFPGTREYVRSILARAPRYRADFAEHAGP